MKKEVDSIKLLIESHVNGDMSNVWETICGLNIDHKLGFDLGTTIKDQYCEIGLVQALFSALGPKRSIQIATKILGDYHLAIADDITSPYVVPVVEVYCLAHQLEPPNSMWGYLVRYRQMTETLQTKPTLKRTFLKLCC